MGTVADASAQDRLHRAREALLRAEERSGVRSARERSIMDPDSVVGGGFVTGRGHVFTAPVSLGAAHSLPLRPSAPTSSAPATSALDAAPLCATGAGVGLGVVAGGLSTPDEGDPLALRVGVSGSSPGAGGGEPGGGVGGNGGGKVLEVSPGTGAMLRAAARAVPAQGWIGFVGIRDIGWVAAGEVGIDLSRVLSVPDPGPVAVDVVATLLDGVDVLCVEGVDLSAPQQRRLAARIRRDGRVVLTTRGWPGISRSLHEATLPAREEAV